MGVAADPTGAPSRLPSVDPALLTLAGVGLGGFIGGGARYVLDRRAERKEFRAAVWVMVNDLSALYLHLQRRPPGILGGTDYPSPDGRAWGIADRWQPADLRVLARGLQGDPQTWTHLATVLELAPQFHAALLARQQRHKDRVDTDASDVMRVIHLDEAMTESTTTALKRLGKGRHIGHVAKLRGKLAHWRAGRTVRREIRSEQQQQPADDDGEQRHLRAA